MMNIPTYDEFLASLPRDSLPGVLIGVFVDHILAARVVYQPDDDPTFISPRDGVVTRFNSAAQVGSIGLLAHQQLAGKSFFNLFRNDTVYLFNGDRTVFTKTVISVRQFKALSPDNVNSEFVDLSDGQHYGASHVFSMMYGRRGSVVFQTCIAFKGAPTWGRLFVICE